MDKISDSFKDKISSPGMTSMLSLLNDLNAQTKQLQNMFSVHDRLAKTLFPSKLMSEQLKGINMVSNLLPKMDFLDMKDVSSARQVADMSESIRHIQNAAIEERTMRRKGVEAQFESTKILADQRAEIAIMKEAINALLQHSLEQSKQQAIAFQERDKIEAARYRENTRLSKIAAWAGVISVILAAVTIVVPLLLK